MFANSIFHGNIFQLCSLKNLRFETLSLRKNCYTKVLIGSSMQLPRASESQGNEGMQTCEICFRINIDRKHHSLILLKANRVYKWSILGNNVSNLVSTAIPLFINPPQELFFQHGVNIVLAGHVHSFERTWPVYKNETNPCGPVYINIGDGGDLVFVKFFVD